jgi:glycine cleavage system H protein
MNQVPADLRYTKEHEWAKREGALVVVGITDHAQSLLGDVVFLELPDPGTVVHAGQAFGVVESVKAVSDLFAPIDGEVVECNAALVNTPEKVNSSPYGESWMVKIRPSSAAAFEKLMSAADYQGFLESEA